MKLEVLDELPRCGRGGRPRVDDPDAIVAMKEADKTGKWVRVPKQFASRGAARIFSSRSNVKFGSHVFAVRGDRVYCRRKPGAKS